MIHLTDSFQQINRTDLAEQTGLLYWGLAYTTPGFFSVRTWNKSPVTAPDLQKIHTAVAMFNAFFISKDVPFRVQQDGYFTASLYSLVHMKMLSAFLMESFNFA